MATSDLDVDKSVEFIRQAAAKGSFLSFGDVARASGVEWTDEIRSMMTKHLESVCMRALGEAGAMISAIVVNEKNVQSGELASKSLPGFIACADRLGFGPIADKKRFFREQQRLTFLWGRRGART